jgi:uncharacterized protein (TIGR00661 family)
MKILYGIQGTGHGHISRAQELLPEFGKYASVDVLVSGYACQLGLDASVKYRKKGISFCYDDQGGVSILDTLRSIQPLRFLFDIQSMSLEDYNLVVSDYEPVSAWAARRCGVASVALSHQASFLSKKTPRPEQRSVVAEAVLQHFAPTDHALGFHFRRYDCSVEPPIVRTKIRDLSPEENNHITVYLPAHSPERLVTFLGGFPQTEWHVFSPSCKNSYRIKNVEVHPVSEHRFLMSLERCRGVLCGAGFETCAEAMYLGKKLMVVPIRNQYEQICNAAALNQMGIDVFDHGESFEHRLKAWLDDDHAVRLEEIAEPEDVVQRVLAMATDAHSGTGDLSSPGHLDIHRQISYRNEYNLLSSNSVFGF